MAKKKKKVARKRAKVTPELTAKQRLFAEHYTKNGENITQAAISAGYSEKGAHVTGSRLLSNAKVSEYVHFLMAKATKSTVMSLAEALTELSKIGRASMKNVADWGAGGLILKESENLDDNSLAAVQTVSEKKGKTDELKVGLFDKVKALSQIVKHYEVMNEAARRAGQGNDPGDRKPNFDRVRESIRRVQK